MKTKFAIGCLVQWYEIEIVGEYVESLKQALNHYTDDELLVDFTFNINQMLEKVDESQTSIETLVNKFTEMMEERDRAELTDVFKPIFRPPAWKMSSASIKAAKDVGIDILTLSPYDNSNRKLYLKYLQENIKIDADGQGTIKTLKELSIVNP